MSRTACGSERFHNRQVQIRICQPPATAGGSDYGTIGANELKRKLLIAVDGQPYVVLEVFFASPTARGAATMVRTKLRHLLNGAVLEKSFRATEKFEEPDVEYAPASFFTATRTAVTSWTRRVTSSSPFHAEEVGSDRGT